ncbi:MAG: permease [Candidatus Marinimicrobia bacterium]|nr:permease [Candidatus Neomarinimicrobiota bacterium]
MKNKSVSFFSKDYFILVSVVVIAVILLSIFPENTKTTADISGRYFVQMLAILPGIMILLGLFKVWIPKEKICQLLGKSSGVKGVLLSIVLGALPTGPLYIAFPMASALIKKGARVSNIVIFLSAWACIKIPQELVEWHFLGFNFMIARLTLTIIFVWIMAMIMELILKGKEV